MPENDAALGDEIYGERYVQPYAALYTDHPLWGCNVALLSRLLKPLGNWLDTCCGQGWHLAQFPGHRRTGIDRSAAQLEQVSWNYRDAGGLHRMMSPPLEFFTDIIAPHFSGTNHATVVRAVRQFVAWGKRPD